MRWPWHRGSQRDVECAQDDSRRAEETLAATHAADAAVDAIHAEHERRLRENNFGPKIAAALHLRRVR